MRAALAIIVVSCLLGAALAQDEYGGGVTTCGSVDFGWRWGNFSQACGCSNTTDCKAQLCLMAVEYYSAYDSYEEKWAACSEAQAAVSYCDGDSETSENDQAIAAAVTESNDYCQDTCNAWAVGYWSAGWMDSCHCADPTSDVCYVANCYSPNSECYDYQYRLLVCQDQVEDYSVIATPVECANGQEYTTLCNGDYLTAIYELWYSVSPACDPESDNYNDDACTRLTCGDITQEQEALYNNVYECDGAVTDEVLAVKVEADYHRYAACMFLPDLDCSESAVATLLAQAAVDCEGDICNAFNFEDDFTACSDDYDAATNCLLETEGDTNIALATWLAGEEQCYGPIDGSSGMMDSTASAVSSISGATSEYQGSMSSSSSSSSSSSTAHSESTGLGDNNAASAVTVGVAVLASVALLL